MSDFTFDSQRVFTRMEKLSKKAQFILDSQVVKDSNYYIPKQEGILEASGVIGATGGVILWQMPYARKQYYDLPNKSLKRNPNARSKWFEAAKATRKEEWLKAAQGVFE